MDGVLPGCNGARPPITNNRRAPCRADNVVISAYGFQGSTCVCHIRNRDRGLGGSEEDRTTERENSGRSSISRPLCTGIPFVPVHKSEFEIFDAHWYMGMKFFSGIEESLHCVALLLLYNTPEILTAFSLPLLEINVHATHLSQSATVLSSRRLN